MIFCWNLDLDLIWFWFCRIFRGFWLNYLHVSLTTGQVHGTYIYHGLADSRWGFKSPLLFFPSPPGLATPCVSCLIREISSPFGSVYGVNTVPLRI